MSGSSTQRPAPVSSLEVRERLVEALKLDLVGPWAGHLLAEERLRERPSKWYLTGFLIPSGTPPEERSDPDEQDDVDETPESAGLAEESAEERKAAKKGYFPSSMGLSFLVPPEARALSVTVRRGDYSQEEMAEEEGRPETVWRRQPREETVDLTLGSAAERGAHHVPGSGGLQLYLVEGQLASQELEEHIPHGTRPVSVFLVNHRERVSEERGPDMAYAFQPEIEVRGDRPFYPRPDLSGTRAEEWDEQVADLHYAGTPEYATGHGVSVDWEIVEGECRRLCTVWIPSAEVEKTVTVEVEGVELSMPALGGSRTARRPGRPWARW